MQGATSSRSSSSRSTRVTAAPFGAFPLAPGELPDGAGTCPVKETLEAAVKAAHHDMQLAAAAAEGAAWASCDLAGRPLSASQGGLQGYKDRWAMRAGWEGSEFSGWCNGRMGSMSESLWLLQFRAWREVGWKGT